MSIRFGKAFKMVIEAALSQLFLGLPCNTVYFARIAKSTHNVQYLLPDIRIKNMSALIRTGTFYH